MPSQPKLLVVDDEKDVVYSFRRVFEKSDYEIVEAYSGEQAVTMARSQKPDVVIMDIRMPGMDGIAALREIRRTDPRTPIILMTAYGSTESTIEAMKAGAFDYVLKPFEIEKMRGVVQSAVKISRDMRELVSYQPLVGKEKHEEEIVGQSEPMQGVYKLIGRLSNSDLPVLITGESGTGKELVARAIYQHSRRASKSFLAVNCAAIPENLLESELFGYQRGAFTGAAMAKPGKLEVCDGGTILLDEIGEMPVAVQTKLLRVLETGELEKLGSTRATRVDVRVMAATNRDLPERIKTGEFRADLYYRLRVVELAIPPLRERAEDIPLLVEYFVRRYARQYGTAEPSISDAAMQKLQHYPFPGNVRELQNVVKNALVRLTGTIIRPEDLELGGARPRETSTTTVLADEEAYDTLFDGILKAQPLPEGMDAFDLVERKLVIRALAHCTGNQSQAAKLLGITRNTLRKRIQKYGLRIERSVSSGAEDQDSAGDE